MVIVDGSVFPNVLTWTVEMFCLLLVKTESGQSPSVLYLKKKTKTKSTNMRNLEVPKNQCVSFLVRKKWG